MRDLLNLPHEFERKDGSNVAKLLRESYCDWNDDCTPEKFLNSDSIRFNSVELEENRDPLRFLSLREFFFEKSFRRD